METAKRPLEQSEDQPKKKSAPTCSVCLELIYEPHVGTCGHSICGECVPNDGKCPYCRKTTVFQTNFMFRDMLQEAFGDEYRKRAVEDTPERWVRRHKSKNKHLYIGGYSVARLSTELIMKKLALVEKFFMVDGKLVLPEDWDGLLSKTKDHLTFNVVFGEDVGRISSLHMMGVVWVRFGNTSDNNFIWVFQ